MSGPNQLNDNEDYSLLEDMHADADEQNDIYRDVCYSPADKCDFVGHTDNRNCPKCGSKTGPSFG